MAKHRPSYKWRAVKVAAFFWGLQIEKQKIKAGEGAYKANLPADANWAEEAGNEGRLRRRGIMTGTSAAPSARSGRPAARTPSSPRNRRER
jgi:hypothetical protein